MRYRHLVPGVVAGIFVLWASTALAQGISDASADSPTIYRLNPSSSLERGCFPPCLCSIRLADGVRGTFVLTSTGFDGLFNTYAVTDVNWTATVGGDDVRITGSGTYRVGGEVAVQQQLALDLRVGDGPVQHFDSGLLPGGAQFPDIGLTVSLHGQVCFDTAVTVDASPVPADQIHPYALLPDSLFQRGCFPPCLCPLQLPLPISGTFALVDLRQDGLFTEFAVVNVNWAGASLAEAPDSPPGPMVVGFGTYRVGGEVAVQQQLSLDLRIDTEDFTHFDSGLVVGGGGFPGIDISIAVNGGVCVDTVIDLHAFPADGVTGATPLRVVPASMPTTGDNSRVADSALSNDCRGVVILKGP